MTKLIILANLLIDIAINVLRERKVYKMARAGLDQNIIVSRAAQMANEIGLENITLKMIAKEFGVQTPSLYNHIKSLEDLRKQLMIYGWKQLEQKILHAVCGVSGYDALREICNTFYEYATANPGVFNAMLWYNKFQDEETQEATGGLFPAIFKVMESMNISQENANHLIRTFRSFLEGFALLVNNGAFGNPISIKESFDLSVDVLLAGVKTLEEG